jgi:rubrerythrin
MKTFTSINEILDFAIEREIEAEKFYKKLAGWAEDQQMRDVFDTFAIEELRHKMKLQAIKRQDKIELDEEKIQNLGIADSVTDVTMRPDMSYADILTLAMKREKEAYRLYMDLAAAAQSEELKNTFLMLAQEEAKHKLRFEIEYDDVVMKGN